MNLSRVLTANRLRISSLTGPNRLLMTPSRANLSMMGLHSNPCRNFGYLMAIRPYYSHKNGFGLSSILEVSSSESSRKSLPQEQVCTVGGIHLVTTFSGSLMDRELTMSISDYYANVHIKENDLFKMYGVLQKDSLHMKRGALETRFSLTDFKNQVEVIYNGVNKFEFKEGETILITGYMPDVKKKSQIVCVDYMTKHSMEVESWKDGQGYSRENYGLMKSKGSGMGGNFTRIA